MPRAARARAHSAPPAASRAPGVRIVTFASTREHPPIVPDRGEYCLALSLAEVLAFTGVERPGRGPVMAHDSARALLTAFAAHVMRCLRRRRNVFVAVSCADGVSVAPKFALSLAICLRAQLGRDAVRVVHTALALDAARD